MIVAIGNPALHAARGGRPCVFVPTMGALHEGHATLIEHAARLARERALPGGCAVSIFVNPTQFNEKTDYDRYPRTLEPDLDVCRAAGATLVFAPAPADIYPPDLPVAVPPLPAVATRPGLEDSHRPGHFAGVCQVVSRLFDLVQPAAAVFGEKDWQQLAVIRAMTTQQGRALEIIGAPTVRECDGLAMSSRNRFLTDTDRPRALAISRALCAGRAESSPDAAEGAMRAVLTRAGITPEYAVVRDAATLERPAIAPPNTAWRALIAARVGSVRLIDNCAWEPHPV
ncbi:MAG: pantoate--beta-alanine ligase [Phycisphaerales bacterium]